MQAWTMLAALADRAPSECSDLRQSCAMWAGRGECERNSAFMQGACRKSCFQCISEISAASVADEAEANEGLLLLITCPWYQSWPEACRSDYPQTSETHDDGSEMERVVAQGYQRIERRTGLGPAFFKARGRPQLLAAPHRSCVSLG